LHYWLFKTEPDDFSIDDLAKSPQGVARWDGIRNYQARNFLRDVVRQGDRLFLYHSSCRVTGVAGIADIVTDPYPDPAQYEAESPYFDPKADASHPRWYCVDIRFSQKCPKVIPTKTLKACEALADMALFKQPRLSIQPVTPAECKRPVITPCRLVASCAGAEFQDQPA